MRTYLALLLLVAVTPAARAVEAAVQDRAVSLPVPAGFCGLSESDESDERWALMVDQKPKGRHPNISADCGQLADWRAGKRQRLDDYAQYSIFAGQVNGSIQELCAYFRTWGPKILPDHAPDINAAVESRFQRLKRWSPPADGPIGVFAEDPDTCYGAFLLKHDKDTFQLKLVAYTIVNNRRISLRRYKRYTGPDSAIDALAKLKEDVAALHAANR